MRPENLDKLIEHLQAQPSNDLDRRIDALLDSRPKAAARGARTRVIRHWTARQVIAAILLLALVIGIPLFNGDTSNLWARAMENTRKISNYTFRHTVIERDSDGGHAPEVVKGDATWYISAQEGLYIEHYAVAEHDCDSMFYELPDSNEWIKVYPATQEYERGRSVSPFGREMPREMALSLLGDDYVELGTKTVDGRVLTGVRNRTIPDGVSEDVAQWNQELWYDKETLLPACFELSIQYKSSDKVLVNRQGQFRYNTEFPSYVSERGIPDGYTATVVNGLRLFSELAHGEYPRWALDVSTINQKFGDRAGVEKAIGELAPPSAKYGYDGLMRAANFFGGVVQMSPEFAYYGNRVTAQDAHRVLMYWGDPQRSYQVIWGDLRMETLSKDQLIERCHAAGDCECLLDLAEEDDGTRIAVLAACLGDMGDLSILPALLHHADLRQGSSSVNPFAEAIGVIRQREEQRNPSETLVMGRLLYASTRPARGSVQIGDAKGAADRNGYFALMVPCSDPSAELVGYAQGRAERLFLWTKGDQPDGLTIVLEWTSTVRGRVVNQAGTPQVGIRVGVCPSSRSIAGRDWPEGNQTGTDAQGRFFFDQVPVGIPLDVVVEGPDRTAGPLRVRIDDLASDQNRDLGDIVVD